MYLSILIYMYTNVCIDILEKDKQLALAAALSGNRLNQIRGLQTVQELLEGTYQVQEVSKCLDLWWQPVAAGGTWIRSHP